MKTMTTYPTVKAALDALCLDCGFNPFLHGGMCTSDGVIVRRPTIAGLRALGYDVRTEAAAKARLKND